MALAKSKVSKGKAKGVAKKVLKGKAKGSKPMRKY